MATVDPFPNQTYTVTGGSLGGTTLQPGQIVPLTTGSANTFTWPNLTSTSQFQFPSTTPAPPRATRLSLGPQGDIVVDTLGFGIVHIPTALFKDLDALLTMARLAQLLPEDDADADK